MRRSLLLSVLAAACVELPAGTTTAGSPSPATPTSPVDTGPSDADVPPTIGSGPGDEVEGDGWSVSAHPCFGARTDALWFDDRQTVWVGCGSTAEGTGLYNSVDGGRSWAEVTGFFQAFRVGSISRASDGLLYVGGIDTAGSDRVVSLDGSGAVDSVFEAGGQLWNTFQVGTFRRNAEGIAFAESLTGTAAVARFGDAEPFGDADGWWGGGGSYQILDLVLHEEAFYGVGSTIGQPPYVYLPPRGGQDPTRGFRLEPVQLADFSGELWGLDVDRGGVVAVGVDQDADAGAVFTSGPDPYDLDAWRFLSVADLVPSEATWMRGACRSGDTVIAVGEYSQRGAALILRSEDAGATWTDVTPHELDLPALQRCELFDDGDLVAAGAMGVFLTFHPG